MSFLNSFSRETKKFSDFLSDDVIAHLPEYASIYEVVKQSDGLLHPEIYQVFEVSDSHKNTHQLPLVGLSFGSEDINAPAITFVGGIHGIERIGSQVILSYLHTLVSRAK